MKLLSLLNPIPGFKDLAQELARPHPYRFRIALLAAAVTIGIFSIMWHEEMIAPPQPPEIIYIDTLAPGRTREEIIAANIANQKIKDKLAAEQAERDRAVKDIYRTLGKMSGMDVDKIEREAAAEREAEKKAEAERLSRLKVQPVDQP